MSKRFTIVVCAVIALAGLAAIGIGVVLRQVPGYEAVSGAIIAVATIGSGIAVGSAVRRYRMLDSLPPRA